MYELSAFFVRKACALQIDSSSDEVNQTSMRFPSVAICLSQCWHACNLNVRWSIVLSSGVICYVYTPLSSSRFSVFIVWPMRT